MNTFNNILPTSKIQSVSGEEAQVDLITDKGIYISFRGQSLKNFDRLFFTKEQVNDLFYETRNLIDGRVCITVEELRQFYPNYLIIGLDEELAEVDVDNMFDVIQKDMVLFDKNGYLLKVIGKSDTNGEKKITVTARYKTAVPSINIIYKFDDIKSDISLTPTNKITLDEIAKRRYGVDNASFLNITNLEGKKNT